MKKKNTLRKFWAMFLARALNKSTPERRRKPIDALELLRRGYECGIFDDAPGYRHHVKKLLERGSL